MKNCPNCHSVFDDDNDFCPNDGAPLVVGSQFTPTQVIITQHSAPAQTPTGTSPWLYVVIGCLATALVGVGLYAIVADGKRDELGNQTSSASSPSPSPSIAQTSNAQAAQTPAAIPTMPPSPTVTVNPDGSWSGDWSTASGAYYALQVNLDGDGSNGLRGQIVWTLRRTPRPDKQFKVGTSATEYVTGRYDPAGRLVTLKGNSKNDPGGLLVMLDDYRLNLSADGRRLAGRARNGGKWNGIVNLSK
jgi:hypothetical protein